MLSLTGRLAVVVGAGPVGLRKVRSLLESGARVRLVDSAGASTPNAGVELVAERYKPEHLHNATLVFACTDERELNARIAADARKAGALVNAADQPEDCDFFLPAIASDGEVVIAVGTGGLCPSLAVALRDELRAGLEGVGEFVTLLGQIRRELQCSGLPPKRQREVLAQLAKADVRELFAAGGESAVRQRSGALLDQTV